MLPGLQTRRRDIMSVLRGLGSGTGFAGWAAVAGRDRGLTERRPVPTVC